MNTKSSILQIQDLDVETIKKNIKNIHLGVYPPNGRVRVAAPTNTSDDTIELLVLEKMSWIKKQQNKFIKQERQTKREYVSGESHYYLGKRYLLNVKETKDKPRIEIKRAKHIDLYIKEGSTIEQRKHLMQEWYRQQLKKVIPRYIQKWQDKTGITINEWRVKQMKTKWGSCNRDAKRIWLNLELGKKPRECLEYIILHEMVHLLERNHNDQFIEYMNQFMPNWKFLKEKLNQFPISHGNWKY